MDDEASCSNCMYWQALDDTAGNCRRHAPRPRTSEHTWRWPVTDDDDWCGEWEEHDDEDIDIDVEFEDIIERLTLLPRRRWWWSRKGE